MVNKRFTKALMVMQGRLRLFGRITRSDIILDHSTCSSPETSYILEKAEGMSAINMDPHRRITCRHYVQLKVVLPGVHSLKHDSAPLAAC